MLNLNGLLARLDAAGVVRGDEEDLALSDFDWELAASDTAVRIKAVTRTAAESPEGAFQLALELRDALLGDELRIRYRTRIGAISDEDHEGGPDVPRVWRGMVDFGVEQRS